MSASGFAAPLPPFLRFLLAVSVFVWIPGAVVVRGLLRVRTESAFVQYPLDFFAGASIASLIAWPFVWFDASLGACSATLQWLLGALFAAAWLLSWRRRRHDGDGVRWGAAVPLCLLAAVVALQPSTLDEERDAHDHIGYIRQIQVTGAAAPAGVMAQRVDADEAPPNDPRKGAFHDVLAVVSAESHLDPAVMWGYLPIVVFPFAFFAFIAFCRAFVARGGELVACALLFALSYGGVGYQYAETVAYGLNLAISWYWVLVPLVLRPGAGWQRLAAVALLAAGGAVVHIGVVLHVMVLAATVVLFGRLLGDGHALRARTALVMAAGALVAGVSKVAWAHGAGNAIHAHEQGVLYFGRWFVVSPLELLRVHGLLFLGGLAMTAVLLVWGGRSPRARRQLAFAVVPLVVCFVPFIARPLIQAGTYMISRCLLNVPVFPIIITAVLAIVTWSRSRGVVARVVGAAVLIVWGMVFLAPTTRAVARSVSALATTPAAGVTDELVSYIRTLPAGSVILTDPKTAYALSAMTPQRYVAVQGQHGNPLDRYALDRLAAVRDVLSPYTTSSQTVDACDRYGVDFVICNAVSNARAREFLGTWDSADYPLTVAKLQAISGRFRAVRETGDFTVFLHDPAGAGETVWSPRETPLSFTPAGPVERCRVEPRRADEFAIVWVGLEPNTALPGEPVKICLGYEKSGASAYGLPYGIHLRFDHESLVEAPDYPGAKHVRRMRERRGGYALRFTRAHRPFGGRLDVDMWPIGKTFYETFEVDLPRNLRKGNYELMVTIERASLLPNFDARDLLFNRDRLSGTVCATLTVTAQRVREQ